MKPLIPDGMKRLDPGIMHYMALTIMSETQQYGNIFNSIGKQIDVNGTGTVLEMPKKEEIATIIENAVEEYRGICEPLFKLYEMESTHYTLHHTLAVTSLWVKLGLLQGFDEKRLREGALGGLVHDIGKLLVPEEILSKTGKLTKQEWDVMQQHPNYGFMITTGYNLPNGSIDMMLKHHEKLDGSGYPMKLSGKDIPYDVQMLSFADSVDAMTSPGRPYQVARNIEDTLYSILTDARKDIPMAEVHPESATAYIKNIEYPLVLSLPRFGENLAVIDTADCKLNPVIFALAYQLSTPSLRSPFVSLDAINTRRAA
ncbi:MAG: HD domain-containing phosphohydrolase [Nanoarchaeota archaeon]